MNGMWRFNVGRIGAIAGMVLLFSVLITEAKPIKLRNGVIETENNGSLARNLSTSLSTNYDLFIIQFSTTPTDDQLKSIQEHGIELLKYIPEDSYIVRFKKYETTVLRNLSQNKLIQWIGYYLPEYKIDKRLLNAVLNADTRLSVKIMLVPRLSVSQKQSLVKILDSVDGESPLRFGSIVNAKIKASRLKELSEHGAVLWIEPSPKMRLFDELSTKIVAGAGGSPGSLATVHQLGFDGRGVVVAVADSGLDTGEAGTMHPDLFGRVDAFFYYGDLTDASDEHSHGTHVTGIIAGNAATGETDENGYLYGLGVAPASHIVVQRLFDGAGNYQPPPSFETLTRNATTSGAVIGSNSWGDDTQGRYDLSAAEFDALVRDANAFVPGDQQYILEFSAGNAGPGSQTIGSPAVAKNVIATGATESLRQDFFLYADGPDVIADFSSRGPCEDGRIKPDVVAPGTWIASCQSSYATDEYAWAPISAYYQYQGGTSQAGPHVSGAAAVFVQYYRQTHNGQTPSPALVKAALINSAVDLDDEMGTDPVPNNDEGWGRVDLTEIIGSDKKYEFIDQSVLLKTGETYEKRFIVASDNYPLKITLVYTDVPGLPAAIPALVNDLDLIVIAPDGKVYYGNNMQYGESIPDVQISDNVNNVEAVHILEPIPGEYVVKVYARKVAEDARVDTPAIDQDFALVISGDMPLPGNGIIFFDRRFYTSPSTGKIKVYDDDLAGRTSITVKLTSDTETNGENVVLYPTGFSGLFEGTFTVNAGNPSADGVLQVKHGDTISAIYTDESPVQVQIATAKADLLPPIISNVFSTNQYGKTIITFTANEPVQGIVVYGTNLPLLVAQTNPVYQTEQTVELSGLQKGITYRFYVVAVDEAGNFSTNNNNGNYFSFVATPAATLLLVDAYTPFQSDPSPVISLDEYTIPINQVGISYEVWNTAVKGLPKTNDLAPFRVVFWRVNDSLWGGLVGYSGLTPIEQNLLQSYVKSGGSLFISSMELLSRMGTGQSSLSFRSNVLQVVDFVEDAGVSAMEGSLYDPISTGIEVDLDYSNYDADFWELIGQTTDVSDTLIISTNAAPIFFDITSGDVVGLKYPKFGQPESGRVVFLSVPFDAIPKYGVPPNNRVNILRNILSFLAPGAGGIGTISLENYAYTLPSVVKIEVADSDLEHAGNVTVRAFSDSNTNGITVTLTETARAGVFIGTFILVRTNYPQQPNSLIAKDGDYIRVEYFDASANSIARVVAVVDTTPPQISNITVQADYESATITWETDEPSDSLVQYGESVFLGKTAYRAEEKYEHSVTLFPLQPDKTYYFQITSRDTAGNAAIDNNNGKLYTFRTLTPLRTPVYENFDSPTGTNWTVYSGEDTQTEWTLGIPDNGVETSAHSPPFAWGSNIRGGVIDYADTFLISPAIEITGRNKAVLRFWHSYDFSERSEYDVLELGRLILITNQVTAPIVLDEFYDSSGGWTEEEYDLTPYIGRVVYIVFQYQLLSLGNAPRPGWLVDDVQVVVTNEPMGTIIVSNNLFQSTFNITGAKNYAGRGAYVIFTNCSAGNYTISYAPVQFYITPMPQTNYLTGNGIIVFSGNYTFSDTNMNNLSDEWEKFYFGNAAVSPNEDSDSDGMSNYAEFIAGTDPLNPNSVLSVLVEKKSDSITLKIPTVVGRGYRLLESSNLINWVDNYGWFRATNSLTTVNEPCKNSQKYYLIEVKP